MVMLSRSNTNQPDTAATTLNLVLDLESLWHDILRTHCRLWLSRRETSGGKEWKHIDRQVKRLEDLLENWILKHKDFSAIEVLKEIIARTFSDDILVDIFESYWLLSCLENCSYSELDIDFIQRYPSVKYFTGEVIAAFFSPEFQLILEDI